MNIIFVSIPIALILLGIGIGAFFWAVRSGQFDDLDSPAWSILMDEDREDRQREKEKPPEGREDTRDGD